MTEDKKLAEKMVADDVKRQLEFLRDVPVPSEWLGFSDLNKGQMDSSTFIHLTIGCRGQLTRQNAKEAADAWKQLQQRCPEAPKYISLLGYDDDPREIWEIPKVTRYVRMWAHYAGITEAGEVLDQLGEIGVGFLAACGVPFEGVEVPLPPKTAKH
jgi:hypothetical protein